MANIRYYADWSARAGQEIAEEQARAQPQYSRAWRADDGALERVESYDRGQLVRVDYYAGSDAEHARQYPGIPRGVHRVRANLRGFTWSAVQMLDGAGVVQQRVLSLDQDGVELMNVQHDPRGVPTVIEKYHWDDRETLHFVFEYRGSDGQYVQGQDLIENESVQRDGLAHWLHGAAVDRAFYENGAALPRALAGTAMPAWEEVPAGAAAPASAKSPAADDLVLTLESGDEHNPGSRLGWVQVEVTAAAVRVERRRHRRRARPFACCAWSRVGGRSST
jgi:hypothetical protein